MDTEKSVNKSIITNGLALFLTLLGFGLNNDMVKTVGLFALSGAITNWLAVHMLFEKVPGLYGSGVIPQHFEEFKNGSFLPAKIFSVLWLIAASLKVLI